MLKNISAVIPTIGRIEFLDLAIESILNQQKQFDEFIVYDNSKEQNLREISKYGMHPDVIWKQAGIQKVNPIESWNSAISSCSCDYVTVIGDDDLLLDNYVSEVYKYIYSYDLIFLKPQIIDEYNTLKGYQPFPENQELNADEFRFARFQKKTSLFLPGSVFKRDFFKDVGGFIDTGIPGSFFPDDFLYFKIASIAKRVCFSQEISWQYRVHTGQIGSIKSIKDYIDKAQNYISLMESSLIELGTSKEKIYPSNYSRQNYLESICTFGVQNFTKTQINKKIISNKEFIFEIFREYLFDRRLKFNSRFKTFLTIFKIYFGYTHLGAILKVWFGK